MPSHQHSLPTRPDWLSDLSESEIYFNEPEFIYGGPELPPGVASELPEHIYQFEKAWQDAGSIRIYDALGQPFFLDEHELDDQAIPGELLRLLSLMQEHKMTLDHPAEKEPREIYRFLTSFLFEQEIDDLQIEGLSRHFIYTEDDAA